eukprot:SAG22_NODE_13100_length_419_cov_0.687500_1_plen_23_part_01
MERNGVQLSNCTTTNNNLTACLL